VWTEFASVRVHTLTGSCEHDNELPSSVKGRYTPDKLYDH
jgi:hypothetical protein